MVLTSDQKPDIIHHNQREVTLRGEDKYTMCTNKPFQKLFDNFLRAIKDADKSIEVASYFGPTQSTESMFNYIWGIDEAHQCFDFNILKSSKSQTQSDDLRTEANIYCQRGQLDKALECYNMSIVLAPTPLINDNIKNVNDQQKSTSLAYGFANRSAVLFELEQYEKSIDDIDLALKYGYPKDQMKLVERKAKCLVELNKLEDAKALLNSTIHFMSTLNMNESKKRTKTNILLSLLNEFQEDQTNSEHCEENIPNGVNPIENLMNMKMNNVGGLNHSRCDSIPRLESPHSTILAVSSSLRLHFTKEQGRFFVADKDIKPGELILVEKSPFSCLRLNKDILYSHCCVCLMKCNNLVPCLRCNMVMFCSETCQSESLNGHTVLECLTLQTLDSLYMENYCLLAFKVITQMPYMKLKSVIPASKIQLTESSSNLHGFNKNGMFESSDFLSTYAMIDNLSQRDGDDLFKKVAMAFILTKLLIKSNQYFIDEAGLSFRPLDEDIILLGSTFSKLIMSLHCNPQSIEELETLSDDTQTILEVGSAVFPTQSLLNHSCNPGTVRATIGNQMTSYAIKFIPEGAEVTGSYGCHYAVHETMYRQAQLKKKYYFECKCEACIGEWAISGGQSSKLVFKSLKDTISNEQLKQEEDYKGKYIQLKKNYQKAYMNIINKGVNEESKQIVIDFIEFIDRYIVFPFKLYHDVQGLLKYCIDKESSTK